MRGLYLVAIAFCGACHDQLGDPRELELVDVLVRADEPLLRARPALVAGKYRAMASDPYLFFRGSLALYVHDFENGALAGSTDPDLAGLRVPALGDPHPENFGTLLGRDQVFALEPNDFDAADYAPPLFDLSRLCAGLALAARLSNPTVPSDRSAVAARAPELVERAVLAYLAALERPPGRVTSGRGALLADLFERSMKDIAELSELSDVEDGVRRLKRGYVDLEEPEHLFDDVDPAVLHTIPAMLARYRDSLRDPPPPEFFQVLDAARELGSGVASWPRVRFVLLIRGPSDDPGDDRFLEVKEVADAALGTRFPPVVAFDSLAARVLAFTELAWAVPDADPLFGATEWLGLTVQLRAEREAHKTIRVARMIGDEGTFESIAALAAELGALLGRLHARAPASASILERIGEDRAVFARERAALGVAYALQVEADHRRFQHALERLGPHLGVWVENTMDPVYGRP